MQESSIVHSTFVIEKRYPVSPERVFAAFADPARKCRWFASGEHHKLEDYELDFRVGGRERYRSRFQEGSPFPGAALVHEATYQDIVPNRRIVIAASMSLSDHRFSASLLTFELLPAADGTDLVFTDQSAFFEGADGPQMREEGWRKLLEKLGGELAQ